MSLVIQGYPMNSRQSWASSSTEQPQSENLEQHCPALLSPSCGHLYMRLRQIGSNALFDLRGYCACWVTQTFHHSTYICKAP